VIGASMFARTVHLRELAPIVRHHHERFDGQGYPDRLAGEAIPLGARIVSIGDLFDALVSRRIYRPAMDFPAARRLMAEWAGSRCDPALVRAFLDLGLERMTEH
jgi:putative two-component system response regulator